MPCSRTPACLRLQSSAPLVKTYGRSLGSRWLQLIDEASTKKSILQDHGIL